METDSPYIVFVVINEGFALLYRVQLNSSFPRCDFEIEHLYALFRGRTKSYFYE